MLYVCLTVRQASSYRIFASQHSFSFDFDFDFTFILTQEPINYSSLSPPPQTTFPSKSLFHHRDEPFYIILRPPSSLNIMLGFELCSAVRFIVASISSIQHPSFPL